MNKLDTRTEVIKFVINQSQCVPAIRMFFLSSFMDPDGKFHRHKYPILAIRTDHVLFFQKRFPIKSYSSGEGLTPEELIESGWNFVERCNETHAIILDSDYGFIDTDNDLMKMENEESIHAELPWPYDEDRDQKAFEQTYQDLERILFKQQEMKASVP